MALCVNQSGTWRNITTQCVNQSGTWRRTVDGCVNQTGTWRCFGMSVPTGSLSLSPTSYVEGGSATLTWSSTKATCVVSTSNFSTAATSGSTTVSGGATRTFSITFGNAFGNSTAATATLTVTAPTLGSSFGGGFLICRSGGVNWIVSPRSAEVGRDWYSRNDANTRAQQVSGCTGWFVPTVSQLQNPGYICRSFWGPSPCYSSAAFYWSSTEGHSNWACRVYFNSGNAYSASKTFTYCVRAFRCVTY